MWSCHCSLLLLSALLARAPVGDGRVTPTVPPTHTVPSPHNPDPAHVDRLANNEEANLDEAPHTVPPPHNPDPSQTERIANNEQPEKKHPERHSRKKINEGADIVLTKEQLEALKQRKATAFLSLRWPEVNGFPQAPYRFNDDILDRAKIRAAVQHWTDNTCIRMPEVTDSYQGNHIYFQSHTILCNSFVGMIGGGQPINVVDWCLNSFGSLVHEIGHAMGFWHEQSRSDRDSHVSLIAENLGTQINGANFWLAFDNNYSVPYDYTSDMHYFSTAFSLTGDHTIVPKDVRYLPLLGQRSGLSHMDKLMANRMYGCTDKWLASCSLAADPCQNYGYTGADCSCVCPPNTSGPNCETLDKQYGEHLMNQYYEEITSEGLVTSPEYPNSYPRDDCVKVIKAPECKLIQLTFITFAMYQADSNGNCIWDAIELITLTPSYSNTEYCGTSLNGGVVVTSTTNELAIYHRSVTFWMGGWCADIAFIPDPSCPPSNC